MNTKYLLCSVFYYAGNEIPNGVNLYKKILCFLSKLTISIQFLFE